MKLRHAAALAGRHLMQVFVRIGLMCESLVSADERSCKIVVALALYGAFTWLAAEALPPNWTLRQRLTESFLSVVLGPITAARVNYITGRRDDANIASLAVGILSPMAIAALPILWYRKRKTLAAFVGAVVAWVLIGFLWGVAIWV